MAKNNLCIIQARLGSTRLPGKVLKEVNGISLLEYEIKRVKQSKLIDEIVIATSAKKEDAKIEELAKKIGVDVFRGSEDDVLSRYFECAKNYPEYNNIIRITGDCPLIDSVVVDKVIEYYLAGDYDYVSNTLKETYPDGMDIEIFTREALEKSFKEAKLESEREHLTQYMIKNEHFKKGNLESEYDWSHFRLTVDEKEDFEVVKFLIENCPDDAGFMDYIVKLTKHPKVMLKNMNIIRNEGLIKSLKYDRDIKKNSN